MSSSAALPDAGTLSTGLAAVLGQDVTVVARNSNPYASRFPSEIVTCQAASYGRMELFCKYSAEKGPAFGAKSGVPFEAMVYREILQPLNLFSPRFYGRYTDRDSGLTWLVIEHLDRPTKLKKSRDPRTHLEAAARWAGEFHRANAFRVGSLAQSLHSYTADYYAGWAQRTSEFASSVDSHLGWVTPLCERYAEFAATTMMSWPGTIIHGEYYPDNILIVGNRICPVDWESAAVGLGEIDLASLMEKWGEEYAADCPAAYREARWAEETPGDFEYRLSAARLYLHLRWLGQRQDLTHHSRHRWRFDEMRLEGERLGLL